MPLLVGCNVFLHVLLGHSVPHKGQRIGDSG
jgi:hypothetical protein